MFAGKKVLRKRAASRPHSGVRFSRHGSSCPGLSAPEAFPFSMFPLKGIRPEVTPKRTPCPQTLRQPAFRNRLKKKDEIPLIPSCSDASHPSSLLFHPLQKKKKSFIKMTA